MRLVSSGVFALAVAAVSLGGCLHESQFHGTVAGSEQQVVARHPGEGNILEVRQQYLTDYDFWGERRAGSRFDYFVTNTGSRPRCFSFRATGLEAYVIREKTDGYPVTIAPGQQAHVAYVRADSGPRLTPAGDLSFCD